MRRLCVDDITICKAAASFHESELQTQQEEANRRKT
jgi:hypothetical protein